jgi:Tfp pilus assembly protein FimT
LLIATPLTLQNIRRARADNLTQTLYSNIAEARQRAIQRNLPYLIEIKNKSLKTYEDKDSDGTTDSTELITLLSADKLNYDLAGNVGGTAISSSALLATANRKGFLQPTATIYLVELNTTTLVESRNNCVVVDFTRVSIGKYNGTNCVVQ